MTLINLKSFINSKRLPVHEGDVFVAQTDQTLLVGPKVTASFCPSCFKRRILSSELREFFIYENINNDKAIKNCINKYNLINVMLEISKNKTFKHFFLLIPGCNKHHHQHGNKKNN